MNATLCSFPIVAAGTALLCGELLLAQSPASTAAGEPPAVVVHSPSGPPASSDAPGVSGQQMVAEAVSRLSTYPSITAQIRQRVDLFGQKLVGSGSYLQLGEGEDRLLRLELTLQVGQRVTSVQQVCDGRFHWVHRDLPDERSLSRVDLRRVGEAISAAPHLANPAAAWLGVGGLPKLLVGLEENFRFSTPRAGKLGEVAVWQLHGSWQKERLAEILPQAREAILEGKPFPVDSLPSQLPHHVVLGLGQDDLFPYRIEYHRRASDHRRGRLSRDSTPSTRAIVTIELFEVALGAAIDPLRFVYKPGDLDVQDHTERYLQSVDLESSAASSR